VAATWDLVPELGLNLVNDPGMAIRIGPDDAGMLRWAYLADMVGYYLLLVPIILALRAEDPSPAGDIGAVGGLAYVVLGGGGAALLAALSPPLIDAFAEGGPAERVAARTTFVALTEGVQHGVWQSVDAIAIGTWALLVGRSLRRTGAGLVGGLALVMGVLALAGAVARILGFDTALLVVFLPLGGLIPLWLLLVGLRFLRQRS
jgi:hypothetical protein